MPDDRPIPEPGINPYIAFAGDPELGAALVFAHSAREARRLAFDTLRGWFDCTWPDVRARRLREHRDYLTSLYDGRGVIEDPPTCNRCEHWGAPLLPDGAGCTNCVAQDTAQNLDPF